ncbi:hypothetical protein M436DRAFT_68007 [Aureobasidium namibiae CBS 147.97]|uniref:Uncharacterized protein n=1 Tax=Aureobasidium namibiae CBS 147.97 TaxID=1043004 RepID=A0A074WAA6_9PEZI
MPHFNQVLVSFTLLLFLLLVSIPASTPTISASICPTTTLATSTLPMKPYEPSEAGVQPTTTRASDLAEIDGLRNQIFGNASALFPDRRDGIDIIVTSAEYPESGYYGARLVDINDRVLLLGRQYAASLPEALGQLLQETCDEIRDSFLLHDYTALSPGLT